MENKKKGLMGKLVQLIRYRWEEKTGNRESLTDMELEELAKVLNNSSFSFSSMYRSWIPKPHKPGELRPITQPAKRDLIILDGISYLLNLVYEEIFLDSSHGFRKGRGPITFFYELHGWGPVDRLIKSDIVKCFDNIDHKQLTSFLSSDLGEENAPFCDLILRFLKTEIRDKKGNNYSNNTKGIPQGSSLSPVLMNIFLHRLDKEISLFRSTEDNLCYIRYADDMIFAFRKGSDSQAAYNRFRVYFHKLVEVLKLKESSIELVRGQPRKTRVLGLIVSIRSNGILETKAPFKRWKNKLTLAYIYSKMDSTKKDTLSTFLQTILPLIKTRIAFSCCCSYLYGEQDLIRYFHHLIRLRINEYRRGRKGHQHSGKQISFLLGKITDLVKHQKKGMLQKARSRHPMGDYYHKKGKGVNGK